MFEDQTYEVILQRMLARAPDAVDRREGSIIYDALAPAAAELAQAYIKMDAILNEAFADTQSRLYLIRRAAEHGVTPTSASYAVLKGVFNIAVDIGKRFSIDDLNYIVTEVIDDTTHTYKLQCETAGTKGNTYFGPLIPIEYINGLTSANLIEVLIYGEDEEETESLRAKFSSSITNPAQDGNIAQYEKWANDYPGIGISKVFPLWNGGNTVKIAITNAQFKPAENTLIAEFQKYMDPNAEGKGNGVAPIGSKVTVTGGTQKDINVSASVVLAPGYNSTEGAADAIADYLAKITYVKNSVSYMRVGSVLLDCASIAEISGLTLNAGISDIALTGDEIPVLSNLNLTVVIA